MYDKIAHYYDLSHADLTADINYVLGLAKAYCSQGGEVLELGCGTGRLLIPLARAGYHVTGVDKSAAMLARARHHLRAESRALQERVKLVQADMAQLDLGDDNAKTALVIISYNTFMHLNPGQMVETLKQAGRYLQRDGRLFIDLTNPVSVASTEDDGVITLEKRLVDPKTGDLILQMASNRIDVESQVLHITWFYDRVPAAGGIVQRTVFDASYHYLYPHQIELLLDEAGLSLEMFAGGYDSSPFTEESERLLILASTG